MVFGQKKIFREIDLFDFTSFFGLDFFKISGPLVNWFLKKLCEIVYLLGEPPALYPERQRLLAKTALQGFLLCKDGSLIQSSGPVKKSSNS